LDPLELALWRAIAAAVDEEHVAAQPRPEAMVTVKDIERDPETGGIVRVVETSGSSSQVVKRAKDELEWQRFDTMAQKMGYGPRLSLTQLKGEAPIGPSVEMLEDAFDVLKVAASIVAERQAWASALVDDGRLTAKRATRLTKGSKQALDGLLEAVAGWLGYDSIAMVQTNGKAWELKFAGYRGA
jgi:hypothetical protein